MNIQLGVICADMVGFHRLGHNIYTYIACHIVSIVLQFTLRCCHVCWGWREKLGTPQTLRCASRCSTIATSSSMRQGECVDVVCELYCVHHLVCHPLRRGSIVKCLRDLMDESESYFHPQLGVLISGHTDYLYVYLEPSGLRKLHKLNYIYFVSSIISLTSCCTCEEP